MRRTAASCEPPISSGWGLPRRTLRTCERDLGGMCGGPDGPSKRRLHGWAVPRVCVDPWLVRWHLLAAGRGRGPTDWFVWMGRKLTLLAQTVEPIPRLLPGVGPVVHCTHYWGTKGLARLAPCSRCSNLYDM